MGAIHGSDEKRHTEGRLDVPSSFSWPAVIKQNFLQVLRQVALDDVGTEFLPEDIGRELPNEFSIR